MYLTVCLLHDPGSIPDHGGVFQEIFPWLITCTSLYTVQGRPGRSEGRPLRKMLHEDYETPTEKPGLRRTKNKQGA